MKLLTEIITRIILFVVFSFIRPFLLPLSHLLSPPVYLPLFFSLSLSLYCAFDRVPGIYFCFSFCTVVYRSPRCRRVSVIFVVVSDIKDYNEKTDLYHYFGENWLKSKTLRRSFGETVLLLGTVFVFRSRVSLSCPDTFTSVVCFRYLSLTTKVLRPLLMEPKILPLNVSKLCLWSETKVIKFNEVENRCPNKVRCHWESTPRVLLSDTEKTREYIWIRKVCSLVWIKENRWYYKFLDSCEL